MTFFFNSSGLSGKPKSPAPLANGIDREREKEGYLGEGQKEGYLGEGQ